MRNQSGANGTIGSQSALQIVTITRRPKAILRVLACLVLAYSTYVHAEPASRRYDGYKIVKITINDASELATLKALEGAREDFQIWSDYVGLGEIDVRISPDEQEALEASGLSYAIQIDDLQHRLDEIFKGGGEPDFFASYRTYDEHVTFLNDLADTYPELAETFSLGTSVEGRPLWAIRITGPGNDKPGVMYHGVQHGNEVMGACVVAYMAEYLLTKYDSDPEVQKVVDDVEWFLLPIMNPDGYPNDRHNANGADLNRDWGGPWTGPGAFSEPETAAMRDFFLTHPNIRAHIDFHSSGQMIMWPWGYTEELCEDNPTFEMLGDEMAALIFEVHGTNYARRGPINTTIYPVMGDAVDYAYGVLGIWAITPELNFSQYPPTSYIVPTCEEIAPTMMFLSEWVSDCNGNGIPDNDDMAAGVLSDCDNNATPDECSGLPDFDDDTLYDRCDPDIDNDGVENDRDVCDYTPPGSPIDENGRPIGDSSRDCDISLIDFLRFGDCLLSSGPDVSPPLTFCTQLYDFDGDVDVDLADYAGFARAFTGDQ